MRPGLCLLSLLLVAWLTRPHPCAAGAFMLPPGTGQFIAGVGYSEASRRFDQSGTAMPAPSFSKAEAGGYLEYGVTEWLDLVLAPTLSHVDDGPATNNVTGSDSSAFGARFALFQAPGQVIAVQALVQPPIADESVAAQIADGGSRAFATDIRAMLARSFALFGWPAFVDIDPGVRLRVYPFPDERRIDATFGIRPWPRLMILMQDFSSFASSCGTLIPRTSWSKAQGSVVYDIARRWSVQLGGFRTFAGRDIVRETGPYGAIWYRF